jgi:hypothetical protein
MNSQNRWLSADTQTIRPWGSDAPSARIRAKLVAPSTGTAPRADGHRMTGPRIVRVGAPALGNNYMRPPCQSNTRRESSARSAPFEIRSAPTVVGGRHRRPSCEAGQRVLGQTSHTDMPKSLNVPEHSLGPNKNCGSSATPP